MSERKSSQRFHSLNTEQVEVLHQVLSDVVPIHGRGNFPTLELRPRDIIIAVRARLQRQGIRVRDVRLNGSTASHVLVRDNGTSYKDLDIIFGVELPSQEEFQVIKESVLSCLLDCLPAGVNRERISSATMKEAYVQKMVKVFNEHDRWSLISLSNNSGKNLELKFVSVLRRQFEFSVDSFQIILDRLLESYMQQDSRHKMNTAELKEETAKNQNTATDTDKSSPGRDFPSSNGAHFNRTKQRDEVHEKESQTEISQQIEDSSQTKLSTLEKNSKEETFAEIKEVSEHSENLNDADKTSLKLISEKSSEPGAQTELTHESDLLDENKCSAKQSEQEKPGDGQQPAHTNHKKISSEKELADHTNNPNEQKDLAEQMVQVTMPETSNETQEDCLDLAKDSHSAEQSDKTNISLCLAEGQASNEEEEIQHLSTPGTCTSPLAVSESQSVIGSKSETELCEEIKELSTSDTYTNKIARDEQDEDTEGVDFSCSVSSSLKLSSSQNTLETHSAQHVDNSENMPNTLDAVSPPNTQDIFPAPPGLVSDKKTSSSPSCKASDRLSHMVVLKHSSPKPPRRMCRKIAPSHNSSLVSESELNPCQVSNLCPSTEFELAIDPKATATSSHSETTPTNNLPIKTQSGLEDPADHLSLNLNFTSTSDPAPDKISSPDVEQISALPQEPASSQPTTKGPCEMSIHSLKDVPATDVLFEEKCQPSPGESACGSKQSEAVDSGDTLVSHIDQPGSNIPEPVNTSAPELDHGAEDTTDQETKKTNGPPQETDLGSPCSSQSVTPPVTCLTPPILSLSPPCFTPSPQSLSPPPCLTPPSHCLSSSALNTISPTPSYSSPPLSFSPTSSCLSSPPYLTPPMVNLSPPPLCLTPPSPSLSPPLLCLTPPVESDDLVTQVSSDIEPLLLNIDKDVEIKESSVQTAVSLLQLEDEKENDYISSLPQVTEPVSYPITIPSSSSHVLPHSETGDSGESAPPKVDEASNSVPENKEAPELTSDLSGKCNTLQVSDSVPDVEVLAESMYGDFEAAMDHLRYRLIATRNPEEIRGGGLLKYSNLLVRDYRPASETQIKTLERYMCSRFFIDFPDVQEQQRKILSYLKNHFIGEERSKYQYLMTLRRVVDDSTVCLMGHERRQTLNMITVLALKVLGEQNIIPNTDHVTCFYQPAPYLAEHSAPYLAESSYCSYYIPQGGSTLLYQPYPLHLHPQTGLV